MKKPKALFGLLAVTGALSGSVFIPALSFADNCTVTGSDGQSHTFSTVFLPCGGKDPIGNLLITVVNFLAVGVGIAVLAGIVYGAFLYASSGGSAEQAKKGIGYIRNSVIALVLFILMYAIINFLIPGGLF